MQAPNLFSFAPSELSQDAFICWLLSWADPELSGVNSSLHETAHDFIEALLAKHDRTHDRSDPSSIETRRQYRNADIVAVIGGKTAILIEDKVGSHAHSDQLDRYRLMLEEEFGRSNIVPIYLKTGGQSDYQRARDAGYEPFLRADFLKVLDSGASRGLSSDIFHDFRSYLQDLDKKVRSFETVPVGKWPQDAWKGFFQVLQAQLGDGSWKYVPNQSGGFMGFWWHSHESRERSVSSIRRWHALL